MIFTPSAFRIMIILVSVLLIHYSTPAGRAEAGAENGNGNEIVAQMVQYSQTLQNFRVTVLMESRIRQGDVEWTDQNEYLLRVVRPNQLELVHQRGPVGVMIVSDGTNLWAYEPMTHTYTVQAAPTNLQSWLNGPDISAIIFTNTLPLLKSLITGSTENFWMNPNAQVEYRGTTEIDQVRCHQIQSTGEQLDLALWVRSEGPLLPRKSVIDFSKVMQEMAGKSSPAGPMSGTLTFTFGDWQIDPPAPAEPWRFSPPPGAEQVEMFVRPTPNPLHAMVGKEAPDFELTLLEGQKRSFREHKGKQIVILDFWTTWCAYCRPAMVALEKIAEHYKDQGVVLYAVNQREPAEKVRKHLQGTGLKSTVVLDPAGQLGNLFALEGYPHLVIIGKDGKIQSIRSGFSPGDEKSIQAKIEALLAGSDVVCKSAAFLPADPQTGQDITFQCVVANSGQQPIAAGSYKIALQIDDQQVYLGLGRENLLPGAEVTCSVPVDTWHFQLHQGSSHTYKITVDPDNRISEADETNNSIKGTLDVAAASAGSN